MGRKEATELTSFETFTEQLWRSWLDGKLSLSAALAQRFDLEAAPEPYLRFEAGDRPLVALTTNPGGTLPFQRRAVVLSNADVLRGNMTYQEASRVLGQHYRKLLQRKPAGRRIESLLHLASLRSATGVVQVEVCPFHSSSLPKKDTLVSELTRDAWTKQYLDNLRKYLQERPVVIVAAISSRMTLSADLTLSPWLAWKAELAGMEADKPMRFVALVSKHEKVTCAALMSPRGSIPKAIVLMMGSNQLPGTEGLKRFSEHFAEV